MDAAPIRLGVSSCLLGNEVRFDGGHKRDRFLTDLLGPFVEWVTVCPEVESGMDVPRPTLRLADGSDGVRIVETRTGRDHTRSMRRFSERRVRALRGLELCGYVLKKDSPSCGMVRVKVYSEKGMARRDGVGVFAEVLKDAFPSLPIEEEGRLNDARLRENFIERVFAYRRLRGLFRGRWTAGHVVAFHTAHKLQLMAHSTVAYRELGRLVATVKETPRAGFRERYSREFMRALARVATRGRNANVLQHAAGHLKQLLDPASRQELAELIHDYRNGLVPLVLPISLLRHHARRHDLTYLTGQVFLAPLWLPLAGLVDLLRRRGAVALRTSLLVATYLTCEVIGIAAAGGLWLRHKLVPLDPERWLDLHFRLEAWWGSTLFHALVRLYSLRVEVRGDADLGRGPYLLLVRHASSGDTLIASALVSGPTGMRLRYVLKRELLFDPCLDVVGHRLPNVFVDRDSDDSEHEIRRVQALARDLGARDGILIYPEGTRFSEAKRRRVLERLEQRGDAKLLEYVRSLSSVLPPRAGGTLGLLEAAPSADVVVCAHTGFESAASLSRVWRGSLLRQSIRVEFRRVPRADIPEGREDRIAWLQDEWRRVDAWVENQHAPGSRARRRAS
jgi:uncharacterized protein YbgA (DUF1722 family)/uncharacterized protein YbbK (DUF523 family)/1-acyl-sn-glycerol-3-phosphate acyltransferase